MGEKYFSEKNNPSKPSLGGKEQVEGAENKFDSSHPQSHNGLRK